MENVRHSAVNCQYFRRIEVAKEKVVAPASLELMAGDSSALLSALGRSRCPYIAIRWDTMSHYCHQHERTGSSALWLCRSHYQGVGRKKSSERARTSANNRGLQQPFGSNKSIRCSCLRNLANFGEGLRTERVFVDFML